MENFVKLINYFRSASTPINAVRPNVWNALDPNITDSERTFILEQYKIYVEMADRISARRSLTNTFFLTLNTAVFAGIGIALKEPTRFPSWLLIFPLLALVTQCGAWFFLVRSYRQLNTAKYTVVGVLEEKLPASPYWNAEWAALGEGKDVAKYWPLTHLEQWIPIIFALTYVAAYIAILAS
ncbi:MAG: hypothetical protein WBQ71_17800 [Trebonia sp.]